MESISCPRCRNELPRSGMFCPRCGLPLTRLSLARVFDLAAWALVAGLVGVALLAAAIVWLG